MLFFLGLGLEIRDMGGGGGGLEVLGFAVEGLGVQGSGFGRGFRELFSHRPCQGFHRVLHWHSPKGF